jgi:hypothetical protein
VYTTSPKRKRKIPATIEFMQFMALQTNYVEKLPGDPWNLVTSDQPVRLFISKWSKEDIQTGWIGEGFSKFAVLVCVILAAAIVCHQLSFIIRERTHLLDLPFCSSRTHQSQRGH